MGFFDSTTISYPQTIAPTISASPYQDFASQAMSYVGSLNSAAGGFAYNPISSFMSATNVESSYSPNITPQVTVQSDSPGAVAAPTASSGGGLLAGLDWKAYLFIAGIVLFIIIRQRKK